MLSTLCRRDSLLDAPMLVGSSSLCLNAATEGSYAGVPLCNSRRDVCLPNWLAQEDLGVLVDVGCDNVNGEMR